MNKLQVINKGQLAKFEFNTENQDHFIASLEEYKKENGYYPSEIIMNEEFAQRYFDRYQQGISFGVLYRNKPMSITVNKRFRASELFMK